MKTSEMLQQRKKLPHAIPSWVAQGARHFITMRIAPHLYAICLTEPETAHKLLGSARFYDANGKWHLWLMLLMPDHLHFIATFDLEVGIQKTIQAWRSYHKRMNGISFQKGFFEHRLRNEEEFIEKCTYIRNNPIVKGLVTTTADWAWIVDREGLDTR